MRSGKSWRELLRFGAVGASGVVVNMFAMILLATFGPAPEVAIIKISSGVQLRWYHVFSFTAFLCANLWNFQWNRVWTFRSRGRWGQQYGAFLAMGLLAQGLGMVVLTLLMLPGSAISLPRAVFDNSSFLRTRVYWAQLATIAVVTPVSFLLNKFWTFTTITSDSQAQCCPAVRRANRRRH